jgi:O-antigen/teichoic acid export membrane protein
VGAAGLARELDVGVEAELTRAQALASFFYKSLAAPLEKGCRLLVVFLAAPLLGVGAFGLYQFASTVTALLTGTTELGLGMWTTRALARDGAATGPVLATGLRLRLASAVPYIVLVAIAAATQAEPEARRAMLVLGVSALGSSFVDYFGAILRGREDFRVEAILNTLRAVLTTGSALAGLFVGRSVMGLALGLMVGALGSTALGLGMVTRRYGVALRGYVVGRERARAVFREALPLWLSGFLATLYFRSDIILVRYFSGDAEVGAYAASYRIFEATMLLPAAVMAVAFPRLARAGDSGQRPTRLEVQLVLTLLALGVLIGGALSLADDRLVRLLLGATFERSAASLRVLSWTVPALFVSFATSTFVIARGRERAFVGVLVVLLILNVGLNLVLVPRLGGTGAAWSTLVTEVAMILGCLPLMGSASKAGDGAAT